VEGSAPGMRPDELREGNILEKIYGFFRERYDLPGISVRLVKNIPVGAGLGGGSSDGAGLIASLNRLFSLGLGAEELREIGARFGSDVPFFIEGGTARVGGRGEEVLRMAGLEAAKLFFVLIYPGVSVSTALAYRECVSFGSGTAFPDFLKLIESAEGSASGEWIRKLSGLTVNGFEEKVKTRFPEVKAACEALTLHSPFTLLSGSGSTVFAVFAKEDEARRAHQAVLPKFPASYFVGSTDEGIRLEMMEHDKA